MQNRTPIRPIPHPRYCLTDCNPVTLADNEFIIVPVGAEKCLVVLNDNKLAITNKSTAAVDDLSRRGCQNRLPGPARDVYSLATKRTISKS